MTAVSNSDSESEGEMESGDSSSGRARSRRRYGRRGRRRNRSEVADNGAAPVDRATVTVTADDEPTAGDDSLAETGDDTETETDPETEDAAADIADDRTEDAAETEVDAADAGDDDEIAEDETDTEAEEIDDAHDDEIAEDEAETEVEEIDDAHDDEIAEDETEAETDDEDAEADEETELQPTDDGEEAHEHAALEDAVPAPEPVAEPPAEAPAPSRSGQPPAWDPGQLRSVAARALAVCLALGLIGFAVGIAGGGTNVARAEFVYTLDESVPDSFLREDRRLLTQVVTFESDAVLTPVADRFDLSVDDLRGKIDVRTLELSEVLRLDVTDDDTGRALAINRGVLDRYLQVIADASPVGNSQELALRRTEVAEELAAADADRLELARAAQQDAILEISQESIQRQIDLKKDRIDGLQGLLDDALVQALAAARKSNVEAELEASRTELTALEDELAAVVGQRAQLATATTAEPALLREITRLEGKLATIDDELAERELAPLVASPIRELSEPIVIQRSATMAGLRGLAIGLLLSLPLAAWIAHRTRQRQVWSA